MRSTLTFALASLLLAAPGAASAAASKAEPAPIETMNPDSGDDTYAEGSEDAVAKKDAAKKDAGKSKSGMNGPAASVDSFRKAVDEQASDPWKAAELFVHALAAYTLDRDEGLQMIAMLLPKDDVMEKDGMTIPNLFRQDELYQLDKKPNVMKGYCGGTPANGYKDADVPNCKVVFNKVYSAKRQGVGYPSEGKAKFFVENKGASRPRPIEVEKGPDGKWFVDKFGLLSGVADPAE